MTANEEGVNTRWCLAAKSHQTLIHRESEKAHSHKHVFTRSEHWRRERVCGFLLRGGAGTPSIFTRTHKIFPPGPSTTRLFPSPASPNSFRGVPPLTAV